jgi:DNA-directed RNA polymerase specialized sigma24 family protein
MHRAMQLQFKLLPPEAQRATLWRLAWSGLPPEQIAERTGWSAEQVRRAMHEEVPEAPPLPQWRAGMQRMSANA